MSGPGKGTALKKKSDGEWRTYDGRFRVTVNPNDAGYLLFDTERGTPDQFIAAGPTLLDMSWAIRAARDGEP